MRVLMFGWEFPPFKSGGLGTACEGMATALARRGTEVFFVLPQTGRAGPLSLRDGLNLLSASGTSLDDDLPPRDAGQAPGRQPDAALRQTDVSDVWQETETLWREHLHMTAIDSPLRPYLNAEQYHVQFRELEELSQQRTTLRRQTICPSATAAPGHTPAAHASRRQAPSSVLTLHGGYGQDLMSEVFRYACAAAVIARRTPCDVIHMHDWMTYPAGMMAARTTGRPLVAHVHALECDRSGQQQQNESIARLERAGMEAADLVIAVSHYTRQRIMEQYGIPGSKIEVVHNAVSRSEFCRNYQVPERCRQEKRVLFMGRITYQKGPDYFVEAARLVLNYLPRTRFIMAGSGDMLPNMVRRVGQLRMGNRFHFTGFLSSRDVDRMYAMSDVYVMPSVSEPFGIAPLEAMAYDVPVLVSRQSGVVEVLRNAIQVDFWNVREMANKICALLSYPHLAAEEVRNCHEEMKNISWDHAAARLCSIYERLVTGRI